MPMTRTRAAAVAATATLLLTGCSVAAESRLDFTDTEKVKITEVEIGPGSGDVTVRTADIAEVRIKRVVRYRGDEPGRTYRLQGSVLHVDTGCGNQCSVSYDIEAPTGVVVRGEPGSGDLDLTNIAGADVRVGSGSITVTGSSGPVVAETGSGEITVSDLRGAVKLRSGSGSIEGRGLGGGTLDAETGSGDITLVLDKAAGVRAHASSGNVELTVPQGRYRVRTATESGDETVNVTNDPAGQHTLEVSTGSGDVTVSAR